MMKYLSMFGLVAAPVLVFAQDDGISRLIDQIGGWIQALIPIAMAAALLVFFWGLVKYIFNQGEQDDAKKTMGWAGLALFVMVSIFGIISFAGGVLDIETDEPGTIRPPTIDGFN